MTRGDRIILGASRVLMACDLALAAWFAGTGRWGYAAADVLFGAVMFFTGPSIVRSRQSIRASKASLAAIRVERAVHEDELRRLREEWPR